MVAMKKLRARAASVKIRKIGRTSFRNSAFNVEITSSPLESTRGSALPTKRVPSEPLPDIRFSRRELR
jgi:hypothetical protein